MKTLVVATIAALLAISAIIDLAEGNNEDDSQRIIEEAFTTNPYQKCAKGHGVMDFYNPADEHEEKCVSACYAYVEGFYNTVFDRDRFVRLVMAPQAFKYVSQQEADRVADGCQAQIDQAESTDFCVIGDIINACVYNAP